MENRKAEQRVKLLSITENPLKLVYTAARTCYSEDDAINVFDKDVEQETMLKLVNKILSYGHESIIEHFHVVFAIVGVSRALSHQHVRHRHATFSQKSQRYVTYQKPFKYIIPPSIEKSRHKEYYEHMMEKLQIFYNHMLMDGIPGEDARYIFPNACETSYVFSCNFRELMHISNLRLCTKAQWEIRNLVNMMCSLVVEKEPWTEPYLVPNCGKRLQCKEKEPCGLVNKFLEKLEENKDA